MPTYKKKLLSGNPTGKGTTLDKIIVGAGFDTTFNPNAGSDIFTVAQQSDGKILLGGSFSSVSGTLRYNIARVHENGDLDTTFNPSASSAVISVAQQSDGKILMGGYFSSVSGTARNFIARVHENGALDTTFNPSVNNPVYTVVQQSNGKVLLGGYFSSVSGTARNNIARVHENGFLDTTFDPSVETQMGRVFTVVQQSDGKVLLGGYFSYVSGTLRYNIARVHENGSLDTTFHPNAGSPGSTVYSLDQQSDGKILLGGSFGSVSGTNRNNIARVHENGALDTTFNPSTDDYIRTVVQQSDGKVLLGGNFFSVSATTRNRIARVHENGALDTTFDPSANNRVNAVAEQSNGKVLLGGNFTTVSGTTRNRIARLGSDPDVSTVHNTSENIESLELFVASTSDSLAERQVIIYANGDPIGSVKVNDNSGAKKVFSIPPSFGAGVVITANRTSLDYTPIIFGHVNVQEDE